MDVECIGCGDVFDIDEEGSENVNEGFYVCSGCLDSSFIFCDRCDQVVGEEDIDEDGVCVFCQERFSHREYDKKTSKYTSKDKGKIITSPRTFGIELEVLNDKYEHLVDLSRSISDSFGLEHDGSVRGSNPVEVVSPILAGKKGEDTVKEICETLNKLEFYVNPTCGFHTHLGSEGFLPNETKGERLQEVTDELKTKVMSGRDNTKVIISDELLNEMQDETHTRKSVLCKTILNDRRCMGGSMNTTAKIPFDGNLTKIPYKTLHPIEYINTKGDKRITLVLYIAYVTKEELEEENKKASMRRSYLTTMFDELRSKDLASPYEELEKIAKDKWNLGSGNIDYVTSAIFTPTPEDVLVYRFDDNSAVDTKTLLYLHTAYNCLFYSMIPEDRRQKYRHCQNLSLAFAPRDIEMVQTQDELEALWYKTMSMMEIEQRKTGRKYDPSRYYGLNLHSLFSQNKTIEIRYHAGTTDSESILFWIALHQHILDRISDGTIQLSHLVEGADIFKNEDKIDYILEVLQLPPALERYVYQRIEHFN